MRKFRSNSFLNLLFNYSTIVYNIVTGIFLVPFYLREIPLDVYGSFIVATAIASLIGLMELGLSMVLTQRLSKSFAQADWQQFRKNLHSGLLAATVLFASTCIITLGLASQVKILTQISPSYLADLQSAFLLLGIAAAGAIYLNLFGSIFQALLKAGTLGIINLISSTIGIITVVLAFHWYSSLAAIAAGTFARVFCANILLLVNAGWELKKQSLLPQSAPFAEAIALLRTCLPIFLGSVSRSLADNTQNLLLAHIVSPAAVAVFSLTQKAMQVCIMVLAPIGSSIYSVLTQIKEKSRGNYFASLLGISIRFHFLLSVVIIGTAAVFNEPFMRLWVGADKFGGLELSIMLGVATLLVTRFSFFSFLIYSTGEFKKQLNLEIGYSFTKILLLIVLVPQVGIIALPIADITAGFVFLYGFGNRLMGSYVRESPFGKGIYISGWIEFVAIIFVGNMFVTKIMNQDSWLLFGTSTGLFTILAIASTLVFNASFIKKVKLFNY